MTSNVVEPPGHSLLEVLRRRKEVVTMTFLILTVLSVIFVLLHGIKYGALSHVLLVNDQTGRDSASAGVDMPTIAMGSTVLDEVRKRLRLSESLNDLRRAVDARVSPKSSLMTIAVQDHNPNLAVKINNAVAETFANTYWKLAGSQYKEVARRLNDDVHTIRAKVLVLDRELELASAGASYVGSQASLDATASHLGELEENRGIAFAQSITDRLNLEADLGEPSKMAKVVRYEILRNSPAYTAAQLLVSKDLAQFTTTRAGVNSNYPGMAGFQDKIIKENQALNVLRDGALSGRDAYSPSQAGNEVQTAKDYAALHGDQAKIIAYDVQIKALKQRLSNPPSRALSMGALRAERDAAESQLQNLSLALSNAETSSAQAASLGEVVIVDRATEAKPTLLRPALLLPLALLAALLLSVVAAYLAELLLPRLLGARDVEAVYGRPILATLRIR